MAVNSQLLQKPGFRQHFPKRPSALPFREMHPFAYALMENTRIFCAFTSESGKPKHKKKLRTRVIAEASMDEKEQRKFQNYTNAFYIAATLPVLSFTLRSSVSLIPDVYNLLDSLSSLHWVSSAGAYAVVLTCTFFSPSGALTILSWGLNGLYHLLTAVKHRIKRNEQSILGANKCQ
ncbi:MAG: hypothetical protein ABIH99_05765 [Candidatus Micrarchaeota archaeon]